MPARAAAGARRCSERCRRARLTPVDRRLEARILALLAARAHGATLCPSEAARAEFGDTAGLAAEAMQRTRRAARRLVAAGQIDVLQGGRVVDASYARGPIRLRLAGPKVS